MSKQHTVEDRKRINLSYISLGAIAETIAELRMKYGDDAYIDFREEYGNHECYVVWKRPENAKERQKRLDRVKDNQAWKLKQYKQLKKEFGDDV